MLQVIDKLGLKRALYLFIVGAQAMCVAVTAFIANGTVRREIEAGWRERAQEDARRLAGWVAAPLAMGSDDLVAAVVENALHGGGDAYLVVQHADRTVAARAVKPAFEGRVQAALAAQAQNPGLTALETDGAYALIETVRADAGHVVGHIVYGQDTSSLANQVSRVQFVIVSLLVSGAAIVCALLAWLTSRLVVRPIQEMSEVAERVSQCDLAARARKRSNDDLGRLAESLNQIGENLTRMLGRVQGVAEGVGEVIRRIAQTGAQVAHGSDTVSMQVAETGASMRGMITSLKGIADNVEVLAQSADESSASIFEIATTNDEVAENIRVLAASVEETTTAIAQMAASIKLVAKNVEDLRATADETSSAMNEMDASIHQVESHAAETATLSEQAMHDAEIGTASLSRTLAGIERIKESSREAAEVIAALGRKTAAIGTVLDVIDGVAEQTNLLALNAAILAAQSGEHGKGFAIVADEIKDLAERTGASTKEIAELIRSVQAESAKAIAAMNRGVRDVEQGVHLGQEADAALKKIQGSSAKSTHMVKAIERATVGQAQASKHVTAAIHRVANAVQQIAGATSEQALRSEQIARNAERMRTVTLHVERSSNEQALGSKQVTKALASITDMVNHVNRAQKDQTHSSEQVMGAVDRIRNVAEAQTSSVRDLEATILDLKHQADVLHGELQRFGV